MGAVRWLIGPLATNSCFREGLFIDIEAQLRRLEASYRKALSGAVAAKALYLAEIAKAGSTPVAVAHARREWRMLDQKRRACARAMSEVEAMERGIP